MPDRQWWDDLPYEVWEAQPKSMQIEARDQFAAPCGFVLLRERHRVKAHSRPLSETPSPEK